MLELLPHPLHPPRAARSVRASVTRTHDGLHLTYMLGGDLDSIVIAPPAAPVRQDGLWNSTCFEAFVAGSGTGYDELNLAPSGAWAAYRFDERRTGMAQSAAKPSIACRRGQAALVLDARIAIVIPSGARIGLSAVIEERDGTKSYWALQHGDGPPDFHDPSCFLARLPE